MTKAERSGIVATARDRMSRDLCPEPDPDDKMNRGKYQRAAWAIRLGPDVVSLYIDGKKFKERHLVELAKAQRNGDPVAFLTCLNTLGIVDAMRDRIMQAAGFASVPPEKYVSSHNLARKMLEAPDMPVAFGRDLGIYHAAPTEFRIGPKGRLLFNGDRHVAGEKRVTLFWISGPLI